MKKLTCIFLILAMAFTAAACIYQQSATAPEEGAAAAEEGAATAVAQKLTITETSIPTIDPQQFNSAASYVPMKGICEGLIRTSLNDINPGVAESWEIAEDISQGQQNARRDSTFSVKNEGLSNISSAKATQTEPSPER